MFDFLDVGQFHIPEYGIQPAGDILEEKVDFVLLLLKGEQFGKMFQGDILERPDFLFHKGARLAGEIQSVFYLDNDLEVIKVFDERVGVVLEHGESDNFGFH